MVDAAADGSSGVVDDAVAGRGGVGPALLDVLPAAVAPAVSPAALVELVLVLVSVRARVNAPVFLVAVAVPVFVIPFLRRWAP